MAVTKIWNIVDNLGKVINYSENGSKTKKKNEQNLMQAINYAMNTDKTEEQYFVTGINCEVETAFQEMQDVKRLYDKQGGNVGFHAVQSFKPGEISPELCHEIGVKLANELWGDRFQVVVTTHLNKEHLHNHFVINSVSFKDGYKYYDNHYTYALIRNKSDEICREYNLSVIDEKACKYTKINYAEFYKQYEKHDSLTQKAKKDLDFAISQAFSYSDFFDLMYKLDYDIFERYGKISIRHKNSKRNIRIERRFGEAYTIENIKNRIYSQEYVRVPFVEEYHKPFKHEITLSKRRFKVEGFIALYFHYMYLLNLYPKNSYIRLTPQMRADICKMNMYSEEAKLLAKNKIETSNDLDKYYSEVTEKLNTLKSNRELLWQRRKGKNSVEEKIQICNQISEQTEIINRLRKEVGLLEDIKTRSQKMKDNLKELKEENKQELENNKTKGKEKRL